MLLDVHTELALLRLACTLLSILALTSIVLSVITCLDLESVCIRPESKAGNTELIKSDLKLGIKLLKNVVSLKTLTILTPSDVQTIK